MNSQAAKLIETARGYIGYLEKASNTELDDFTANAGSGNYTVFGAWYGMNGQPWCAMFVSYCAAQDGISAGIIPKHAYCPSGVAWFRAAGRWHSRNGYAPHPGDIVYFTTDGTTAAHVGIVTSTDNARVYTVEGNTSSGTALIPNGGAVCAKSYGLSSAYILGYGNPAYIEEEENMTQEQFNTLYGAVNPMIATIDDVPESLRPEVQKLLDAGVINGGTVASVNARDINMRLETLKAIIVSKR